MSQRLTLFALVSAVLLTSAVAPAASEPKNFCANGGFESGKEHWSGSFELDKEAKRSGQASVRCINASETDESTVSQLVVLDQSATIPIVVSGWSKAEGVSGRKDRQYSLWCDIEYQNDVRPGRVDDWQIVSFDVGTHDWECVETIINPKYPIKHINFHGIFRRTHAGTVWFDDLSIRPLSDGPLAGIPQDMPPAEGGQPTVDMFRRELAAAGVDEVLVSVRHIGLTDRRSDTFRYFFGTRLISDMPAAPAKPLFEKFPLRWLPAFPPALPPPYARLCLFRDWKNQRMIIEVSGQVGGRIEWQVLLPENIAIGKMTFESWEARADSVALHALEGRLLLSVVMEVGADTDRCVVFLEETKEVKPVMQARKRPKLHPLATQDGLRIELGDDGGIWSVRIADRQLTSTEVNSRPFGLLLGDMFQGTFRQGEPDIKQDGDRLAVLANCKAFALRSEVIYEAKKGHIAVAGSIVDATGRDRAIDLLFRLPVSAKGWKWWTDIAGAVPAGADSFCLREDLPFACITDSDGNSGIGLGLSPEIPCRFSIAFDPEESLFHLRCKYALTADAKLKQRANFVFSIFRVDGKWGLRDAARRYYSIYPHAFERRATKEGCWLFAIDPRKVPNPQDYGYYEGSPARAEFNRSVGILTFPYIIPGQRSITHLPRLPATYDEALKAFVDFKEPPTSRWGPGLKRMIENCRVVGADGTFPIRIRDDVGADIKPKHPINMVVFPVNCNPGLFADRGEEPTVARFEMARVEGMLKEQPLIDGIYVDSTSGWVSRYLNFRQDHFPYAALPLTYQDGTGRPAIDGRFSILEFLQHLGEYLHASGRLVFPNLGCGRHVCWLYFAADVVGLEGRALDLPTLRYSRTLAYQKPALRLDYIILGSKETQLATRDGLELFFKRCALYGIYPSIGRYCDKTYEKFPDLYRTYMPIIRRLSAAGWEPVTHASSNTDGAIIERFGPRDGELFFTVYNESNEESRADILVDISSLGLRRIAAASELMSNGELEAADKIFVVLRSEELKVLALAVE